MARKDEPTRNARGLYSRDIGWKADGKGGFAQHRFYLGRDRDDALLRSLQLERAWDAVEKRVRPGRRASWDDLTLQIAQAVARGEAVVKIDPGLMPRRGTEGIQEVIIDPGLCEGIEVTLRPVPGCSPSPAAVVQWLRDLQQDFPFVRLELADSTTQEAGQRRLDAVHREQVQEARNVLAAAGQAPASGQTLHQALDGYSAWIKKTYLAPGGEGRVSQHGVTVLTYVGLLKEHHADVPLDRFGLAELEDVLTYWRNRPRGKRGRPVALDTARDMIKRIRHFVKWLHRSPAFRWRKPDDWEDAPVRVGLTHEEKSRKLSPAQVETYTLDELGVLYEYATPWERALMLLALNCGFGRGEIESLTLDEIHLRTSHGHYDRSGSWVRRLRFKSTVYGEWSLWDETVQGVEWLLARRGKTDQQALLLAETGRPLSEPTAGNNRNNKIPNAWGRLLKRIRKDHEQFRRLSFNKLRKTAGDLVRQVSDGETASVFLSHGTPCRADNLLDVYTNRDFRKVFAALDAVRRHLAPMFGRVAALFPPADASEERPSLSRGTISKIRQMRQQGFKVAKIAEEVGVSEGTVRRYCRVRKSS